MADFVFTAKVGTNAHLFPEILRLYLPKGSTVVDPFYGNGVFWRNVKSSAYNILKSDLATDGTDARNLPYEAASADAIIIDPPYGRQSVTATPIRESRSYRLLPRMITKILRAFYYDCAVEATRVLKPNGLLIIKCQDAIEDHKPRWHHIWLSTEIPRLGYELEDLFVLVRSSTPAMRHKHQFHARKNHSYFLVFRKKEQWLSVNSA